MRRNQKTFSHLRCANYTTKWASIQITLKTRRKKLKISSRNKLDFISFFLLKFDIICLSDYSTTRCRQFFLNAQSFFSTTINFFFSKFVFSLSTNDFFIEFSSLSLTKMKKLYCYRVKFNCVYCITTKRLIFFTKKIMIWKIVDRLKSRFRRVSRRNHDSKSRHTTRYRWKKWFSIERFLNVSKRFNKSITRRENWRDIVKYFLCIRAQRTYLKIRMK